MSNKFEFEEDLVSKLSNPSELAEFLAHTNRQDGDLLSKSSPEIMTLVLEYARLSALPSRSEQEDDHVEYILEVANSNKILDFWIVEVDHILGHYLGLLDEDDRESYRDQQALLRDYAGTRNFPLPADKQIKTYLCPLKPNLYNSENDIGSCKRPDEESSANQLNSPSSDNIAKTF
jgi:hypothetical protein